MVDWTPPNREYDFLFNEVFSMTERLQKLGFEGFDEESIAMMIESWGNHAREVWLPINEVGDKEGLGFEGGKITMPDAFKDAYRKGVKEGWFGTSCKPEHGGMGAPLLFQSVPWSEYGTSTCMALSVFPALSAGVYEVITEHAEDDITDTYAPLLASGEWAGTMCLTEPHAGTDLGMIKTKAMPNEDGSYSITGTKIYITAGEHDMADNILHLVLAKVPGGPSGTKGISLFLVPKLLNSDWSGGRPSMNTGSLSASINGVSCSGTEEKMGIHASPTCVMNFEDSIGWLVGPVHGGMPLMFQMMNRERLATGMMGLGLSEIAYQNALSWCKDRRQGRDLRGVRDPNEEADSILVHPDVRRMLLECKVNNEGCRALASWTGILLDEMNSEDKETADRAEALIALLTPIIKAHFTDIGCENVDTCMQVMGGAGYCSEYGVEQFYRDVRISKIWEGTNGIQALDLAGRKITQDFGKNLRHLLWPMTDFIEENRKNAEMAEFNKPLHQGVKGLQQLTLLMISSGMANPNFLASGATDYCRYFGNVLIGYMWARIASVCLEKKNDTFYEAKLASARFFFQRIYPETFGLAARIQSGPKPLMEYPTEMF